MAAAAKKVAEAPQSAPKDEDVPQEQTDARDVAEAPPAIVQPVLGDKHGRLGAERVEEVRKDAGVAEQTALLEATRTGVIKGS